MQVQELTYTEPDRNKLSGNMGAIGLALTVLAFSAPLTVLAGFIPIGLMFGGVGSPVAFVIGTLALLLFSVGYVTLNNIVKRPGDFYAFISYGLGKSSGLGAGILAAVAYFLILAEIIAFFGVSCADFQHQVVGWNYPWYTFSLGIWLVVGILGYLHVELSAKVLTFAMVIEVAVCLIFSFGVLKNSTPDVSAVAPFTPSELLKNNPAFAVLFVVNFFLGFEATALFRDEVKMPDQTIPRATYGSVIFIGVLYTLCAYAMVRAYGTHVTDIATNAPATMFSNAFGKYVSTKFQSVVSVLVLTSAFASALSTQNVLSRYTYNLGTDGAFPRYLSKVHGKHASPYTASITVSLLVLAVLVPFILLGVRPDILYGQLAGVATAGIIILMTAVNIAAVVWYLRKGRALKVSPLKVFVAPTLSACFFGVIVYLVGAHFELLAGGNPGQYVWMFYCLFGVLFGGIVLAQYFKHSKPEVYRRLGRSHHAED